ncbi:MAG TPA: hypothetical protein VFY23_01090 [Candidatus Limnocylindrales bacterium]|nr:hypothetical protein [Candidatus Limnocylindrales bacterium]
MNARRHGSVMVAGALIATLVLSSPALTAGPGPGGGGEPVDTTGSIYADLIIALRAENGTPILKQYVVVDVEAGTATTEYCVQPVSYEAVPGLTSSTNPVDGRQVWVLPLQGEWIASPPDPLPVAEIEPCDPWPQYAMFVSEVELERLNLVRTSDQVIADKLGDVEMKLRFAESISLQSTGRITFDDTTIDASPENAAIYRSLMETGTIPGLPTSMAGPPALIGPAPADPESNSQFGAWELAAMAIGAAASKGTPLNVDTVEYYNRISGFTGGTTAWAAVQFVQADGAPADSEKFVDYSGFSYNRSQTFKGSVTWLDVPTLTWKVSKISDVVPFTNLSSFDEIGTNTLTGVVAFAQLADDVRALCNFIPDNTFIPGFAMDVPGVDTTSEQQAAITNPAVSLGTLPENVFQAFAFQMTASLLNPFGGSAINDARLRVTVDAPEALEAGDVTAMAEVDGQPVPVPFAVDGENLVGWWGPPTGFPVAPGYNVSTTFEATVVDGAPIGGYSLTLELVTAADTGTVLAHDTGTITVNDNVPTVLWGDPIPKYTTQGTWATFPLRVYSPLAGTGDLTLSVTGPTPLAAGNVTVYGVTPSSMEAMPLTLVEGALRGAWTTSLSAGYTDVTWYANVAVGAPVGDYTFGVGLEGGNTMEPAVITVFAPEVHGGVPPDTILPVVTITAVGTPGATATFTFTVEDENLATIECRLTKDGTVVAGQDWAICTSPKTYTDLVPGAYVFSVRGTDKSLNSTTAGWSWTVGAPPDTIAPVITIAAVSIPGSTATFNFSAIDESPVTFECQLTKNDTAGAWATCTSPKTYSGLKPGTYLFTVRATDEAGNTATESSDPWTVKKGGGAP